MKVLMVNGSPHENRNTARVLEEARKALEAEGAEVETFWIGLGDIRGCCECLTCAHTGRPRCAFNGDAVNRFLEKAEEADAFVFASPVYFAGMAGQLKCFMDRAFYSGGSVMKGKPGAAIAIARRAGTIEAIDQMNKYFQINQMPVATSSYWNLVYGWRSPDEVEQDQEGLLTVRLLARQLVWLASNLDPADLPTEAKVRTNFSR